MSDLEVVALSLTAEYLSIDSEYQLFRTMPTCLSRKIERSVYNRRRRKLFFFTEYLRRKIVEKLTGGEKYFIVDSMPLEVCKLARAGRCKICRHNIKTSPDKGYCASQKMYYFGYKIHAVCSVSGVFANFDITKASTHDINYLKNNMQNCIIIGDKGYLSVDFQLDLFNSSRITLEVPMRKNQKNFIEQPSVFRKTRKRIETLFSQLCDQFMIRRNYAKTFDGFKTRILSKLTTLTVMQLINFMLNKNINNIKNALV